jgi:hypothetical protein
MDLIVLLETYLHELSFLVSFDRLVVNRHDCIGDPFGNIGVKMPFSGIKHFFGSQTKMNVFNVFFGNLLLNAEPPITSRRPSHFISFCFYLHKKFFGLRLFVNSLKMVLISSTVVV